MTAVWVQGPGAPLPCGARQLGDEGDGRVWLDVCILGQHLPQMYRPAEVRPLDTAGCERLGLCPDCLGFGDTAPGLAAGMAEAARSIDQLTSPCPGCGGSGRPAIRVTITRSAAGTTGELRPVPHLYVPPLDDPEPDKELQAVFGLPDGACLACGMPQDGTGPRDEALHEA